MGWLARKADNLGATLCGGAAAVAASLLPAFAAAYLQRLGGRLDEARDTLERIRSGEMIPGAADSVRLELTREQAAHVAEVEAAYRAIADAAPTWRPVRVLLDLDWSVADGTLTDFIPALTLDSAGAVWALAGLVIGLGLWELIKLPAVLVWRSEDPTTPRRPRRKRKEPHL